MNTATAVIVIVVWVVVGMLAGLWMARRGHDPMWVMIGAVFGPLLVPIAYERVQRHPNLAVSGSSAATTKNLEPTTGLRAVIGWDGSAESEKALATFVRRFGPSCGYLVVAEVLVFESADEPNRAEVDAAAQRLAAEVVGIHIAGTIDTKVLAGPPGPTLRMYAVQNDMDVIVVGRRGRGLSNRLVGSASADLVERSTVAVLVL